MDSKGHLQIICSRRFTNNYCNALYLNFCLVKIVLLAPVVALRQYLE